MNNPATPAAAETAAPPARAVLLATRLEVLRLLTQLALITGYRLLAGVAAVTRHSLANIAQERATERAAGVDAGLLTHLAASIWRVARMRRIAHWAVMLGARLRADPQFLLSEPSYPPSTARRAPRRPPAPADSPEGFARALARLRRGMALLDGSLTRDDARALERALARRGVMGVIAGLCRDLRIEAGPHAAIFREPVLHDAPPEEAVSAVLSVRDWLAKIVARVQAAVFPPALCAAPNSS